MSLRVGQEAPDFTATAVYDQEFKEITLSSYKGKWVVLFFYPLDFTLFVQQKLQLSVIPIINFLSLILRFWSFCR